MVYENFATLRVSLDRGVAFVTIDHGELNLMDLAMLTDLDRAGRELEADAAVKVVVLQSANPEFFIAHADINVIAQLPETPPARDERLGWDMRSWIVSGRCRRRPLPRSRVVAVAAAASWRSLVTCGFSVSGRGVLCQPEVGVGIIPGAGGSVRLPRLVGRGRALEIILGCGDFPAEVAERYGYAQSGAATRRDRLLRELPGVPHRWLSSRDSRHGETCRRHGRSRVGGRTRSRGDNIPEIGAHGIGKATHGDGAGNWNANANHRKMLLQPCLGAVSRTAILRNLHSMEA